MVHMISTNASLNKCPNSSLHGILLYLHPKVGLILLWIAMRIKFNRTWPKIFTKTRCFWHCNLLECYLFYLGITFHVFGGKKFSKFSLYALLKLTQDSLTSKDLAFELNMHLGPLTEREISDLNLSKIIKLLSQYYLLKKNWSTYFLRVPMPQRI